MIQNAIQSAIVLLKKSAQDLAHCYTMDGEHPSWTHSAKKLHDESVSTADGLRAVDSHIAQLEAENAAHLARLARLESQLATEVERLDFVIKEFAFVEHSAAGSQLKAVCEFDEQVSISGNSLHPTPRAAIDAARELAKGGA